MTQLEYLMETNATTNDLLDIIVSYRYLVTEKEKEIRQLKEQLSQSTYTPPIIQDGVIVKIASVKYDAPVTIAPNRATAKSAIGIKWYEDELIYQN